METELSDSKSLSERLYLLKDAPPEALFQAVRNSARGEVALAPSVARKLTTRLTSTPKRSLSNREIEVLTLASRGNPNKAIANQLHITETIEFFIAI